MGSALSLMLGRDAVLRLLVGSLLFASGCRSDPVVPALAPSVADPSASPLIAGDATSRPLLGQLSRHFWARGGMPRFTVADQPLSVSGALAAIQDGVLTATLLALPAGAEAPPAARPIARSRVLLAAGPGTAIRHLEVDTLIRLIRATGPVIVDGEALQLRVPETTDAAWEALAASHDGVSAALTFARQRPGATSVSDAETARDLLRRTAGSLTVLDLGTAQLHGSPYWPVTIEGLTRQPYLTIYLALAGGQAGARPSPLDAFAAFAVSESASVVALDLGYEAP